LVDVDPRLMAKINEAKTSSNKDLKVIFSLKEKEKNHGDTQRLVDEVVASAENEIQEKPKSIQHLPKLGVLIVEGSVDLIEKMIQNPKISTATISESSDFTTP
jgi:DNA-directed RNA polymerase subunit F